MLYSVWEPGNEATSLSSAFPAAKVYHLHYRAGHSSGDTSCNRNHCGGGPWHPWLNKTKKNTTTSVSVL